MTGGDQRGEVLEMPALRGFSPPALWKKQEGISLSFKFFATQEAHPLSWLDGWKGQSVSAQVQNGTGFFV